MNIKLHKCDLEEEERTCEINFSAICNYECCIGCDHYSEAEEWREQYDIEK